MSSTGTLLQWLTQVLPMQGPWIWTLLRDIYQSAFIAVFFLPPNFITTFVRISLICIHLFFIWHFFFLRSFGHIVQHTGYEFPYQGLNLCPLPQKNRVQTTGLLGNSPWHFFQESRLLISPFIHSTNSSPKQPLGQVSGCPVAPQSSYCFSSHFRLQSILLRKRHWDSLAGST